MIDYWNDGASWSISVEAFFYGLFPFVFAWLRKQNGTRIAWLIFLGYVLCILPGLLYILLDLKPGYARVFYSTPIFRLPEFILGICAYLISRKKHNWSSSYADGLFLICVLGVIVYLGVVGSNLPIYITHNWIIIPMIFVSLIFLGNSDGNVSIFLSLKPFILAGKASYCFYSFQPLVILYLIDIHPTLVNEIPLMRDNKLIFLIAFLSLSLISMFMYLLIERPAKRWLKAKLQPVQSISQPTGYGS